MKKSIITFLISSSFWVGYSQVDTNSLILDSTFIFELMDESESIQIESIEIRMPASIKAASSRTSQKGTKFKKNQALNQFSTAGITSNGQTWSTGMSQANSSMYYSNTSGNSGEYQVRKEGFNKSLAGQLTGAELSDYDKYELWQHVAKSDFKKYSQLWSINPSNRYSVQVINSDGRPIVDAVVALIGVDSKSLWKTRTDNTGSAELWGDNQEGDQVIAYVAGQEWIIQHPKKFKKGINRLTIQTECNLSDNVDIAFIVDATGSMSDEIKYLQSELEDIIGKVKTNHESLNFSTASVFYRCTGNEYAVRRSDFTANESITGRFIRAQEAAEGGAELVDSALIVAIEQLSWSTHARARIAFLILDEPPANDSLTKANLLRYTTLAAVKGIRIVPVVASANYGTEESLEYLMRCIALYTNASYVFLTDDSGVGDPHAKPTVDEYQVELFNKLLKRLINEYTYVPECNQSLFLDMVPDTLIIKEVINNVLVDSGLLAFQDSVRDLYPDSIFETNGTASNQSINWTEENIPVVEKIKIWPNPTMGQITVEVTGSAKEVFLANISGKIIAKYPLNNKGLAQLDISQNPAGIYSIQCISKKKWLAGKLVLMK